MTTQESACGWTSRFVKWNEPIYDQHGKPVAIPSYACDEGLSYEAAVSVDATDGDGAMKSAQVRKHFIATKNSVRRNERRSVVRHRKLA
jgi:hypothetical protein